MVGSLEKIYKDQASLGSLFLYEKEVCVCGLIRDIII